MKDSLEGKGRPAAHNGQSPAEETGTAGGGDRPPQNLFSPLTIRGVTFRNRIGVSPMCQYCAVDGTADDWHLVHLGSRAAGGAGAVIVEATAVSAEGRITNGCLGIWEDRQIEPLARIARFVERMGAVPGIQIGHAGRKASCRVPWEGGARLKTPEEGGWTVIGPSTVPFNEDDPAPRPMDEAEIKRVTDAFVAAARRALAAGFRVIEIHSAHGYLLHQFLSPLCNDRTDRYGGSLENRMRLVLEVATRVRSVLPEAVPLFARISATDWVEGGWDLGQSVVLAKAFREVGVDLVDVSSGAMVPYAKIPVGPGYQVPFSAAVRNEANIRTGAVGFITEPAQADEIISSGKADMVFLAKQMLREPYWAIRAAQTLGREPDWPTQYGYAVRRKI